MGNEDLDADHRDPEPDHHHDGDGRDDDDHHHHDGDDNDNAGETSSVSAAPTRCHGNEGRHRWVSINHSHSS